MPDPGSAGGVLGEIAGRGALIGGAGRAVPPGGNRSGGVTSVLHGGFCGYAGAFVLFRS